MFHAGIDWSDCALEYHLRTLDGRVLAQGSVAPNPEGLCELFAVLAAHAAPHEIGIAIEGTRAAWIQYLLDRGYRVYPFNPKQVDSFREALSAAGNKSDRIDAKALAMFLAAVHREVRPLEPDDPEIVTLRILCQDRVKLVEQRTARLNELQALLKCYCPVFLGLFGELDSAIALKFLAKYPTQGAIQALSARRLKGWLRRHHYTCPGRMDQMVAHLQRPVLDVPEPLQEARAWRLAQLARRIQQLNEDIAELEAEIARRFEQQPEASCVGSLPQAGPVLQPAILACFGRDRERFAEAADAQAFMGTAPVTASTAKGRRKVVKFRRGCCKFARRTMQLFADQSRRRCAWAREFYQKQIDSGHRHHAALRALAHKWVKIILAMLRTNTPYDEAVFLTSRRRYLLNS
jgi:transposase